jgi:hypothetical protein
MINRVGTIIGVEYRAKHNGYVHSGIRYDQTGLTTYAPSMKFSLFLFCCLIFISFLPFYFGLIDMNLVKDPRYVLLLYLIIFLCFFFFFFVMFF